MLVMMMMMMIMMKKMLLLLVEMMHLCRMMVARVVGRATATVSCWLAATAAGGRGGHRVQGER